MKSMKIMDMRVAILAIAGLGALGPLGPLGSLRSLEGPVRYASIKDKRTPEANVARLEAAKCKRERKQAKRIGQLK
jgi:hypothetical protein